MWFLISIRTFVDPCPPWKMHSFSKIAGSLIEPRPCSFQAERPTLYMRLRWKPIIDFGQPVLFDAPAPLPSGRFVMLELRCAWPNALAIVPVKDLYYMKRPKTHPAAQRRIQTHNWCHERRESEYMYITKRLLRKASISGRWHSISQFRTLLLGSRTLLPSGAYDMRRSGQHDAKIIQQPLFVGSLIGSHAK